MWLKERCTLEEDATFTGGGSRWGVEGASMLLLVVLLVGMYDSTGAEQHHQGPKAAFS